MKPWSLTGSSGIQSGSRSRCPQGQCFPPQRSQEPPGCPRSARPRRRLFTPDQILKLLYAADREWRGMILAGYFTGARLGNLARLKWENIDLVERSFTFLQDKTDVKIKVPIHPSAWNISNRLICPPIEANLFSHRCAICPALAATDFQCVSNAS